MCHTLSSRQYPAMAGLLALVSALSLPAQAQHISPTITTLSSAPSWGTAKPDTKLLLTVQFSASGPTSTALSLRTRLLNKQGRVVDEATYRPPTPTSRWTGLQKLSVPINIPGDAADGAHDIQIDWFDPSRPMPAPQPDARVGAPSSVAHVTVTRRALKDAPLACDGTDETDKLKTAFSGLKPGDTLRLPPGRCRFSQDLYLHKKTDVEVVGAGMDDTVLLTSVPFKSAIIVTQSDGVTVRDLTVQLDKDFGRHPGGHSRGLYAEKSSGVQVLRTRHLNMAGAGIAFFIMRNSVIQDNEVIDSAADGIHVTGGCQDIVVDGNLAVNTGDDSFSSIGYDNEAHTIGPNQRIRISNNRSFYSHTSGVSVEGTKNIVVSGNLIESSGVASIRVASIDNQDPGQITGAVDNARIVDNTVRYARTRAEVDHAAIMVFADYRDLSNISIEGNRIEEPHSTDAILVRGLSGTRPRRIVGASIRGNTVTSTSATLRTCLHTNPLVDKLVVNGNTWNGASCP